ncbi:selenium cofactor biosynthesis protein YqeC [Haloarculaceae archaeon H-GB2-1]|nr:selenium cofactor biosynthesis protein YqeC [Haloarculaceae archaeon H-GB1-1]MEA5385952.1 selenium cofactor biosynthesis protein YqeC [Haloarculaceae archaeon H-GB11]MEA5407458.1 selenium cofactor biosynthesis protein YqeC [Haloarculaceae archaeon H-GB2-1]
MDIESALDASGTVAAVGAGGKKTTMYALAERIDRAVVTATVRIPIFDQHVEQVEVTDDPVAAVRQAETWPVGVVPERERDDRYLGYEPAVVDDLAAAGVADAILVKADGARMRQFKAPSDREPQIPASTDTVIPIASARVVGESLGEEHVHRPELVSKLTGRDLGEEIRPADVGAVMASEHGGLKDVPDGATVVPLVNMVDDADLADVGREIATELLSRVPEEVDVPRVVLARMIDDDPLVDVVT